MAYRKISELPLISGGKVRAGEPDAASVLHMNVVEWNDGNEQLAFWAGEDDHPVNGGTKRLFRGRLNPDSFNDAENKLQKPFTGFNIVREPAAPVHDFYDADNFPFDADTSTAARFSDFSLFVYDNFGVLELRALVTINNHQTTGKNHVGLLKSIDQGFSWEFVQEVLNPDADNQGTPFGFCENVDGVIWAHIGDATGGKRERSSVDGGQTWAEHGLVIQVDDSDGSPNATNNPVGRGFIWRHPSDSTQDKAICFNNNSRAFNDWPNTISLYWKLLSDLGNGQLWSKRDYPISICGPTGGGEWQANRVVTRQGEFLLVNQWGLLGFDKINSLEMNELITTPYAGISEGFGFKSVFATELAWPALWENLDYFPFTDGEVYQLRCGGQYLASADQVADFGGEVTMLDDANDERTKWRARILNGFVRFEYVHSGPALALWGPGLSTFADKNAPDTPVELRTTDETWSETDMREQWMVCLVGAGRTDRVAFFNRDNRLVLEFGGVLNPDRNEVQKVWKVIKAT